MGEYRVAEVCLNGHVSTNSADVYPNLREEYCSKCGEKTIMQCPSCEASIRGRYYVPGSLALGSRYEPPPFCHACGNSFPWTERRISAAVELVEAGGGLSDQEIQEFREGLDELTKDSPKAQVASLRFGQLMSKAGAAVASGVKSIIVDIVSETARKAIWGG